MITYTSLIPNPLSLALEVTQHSNSLLKKVKVLVAQLPLTLCDPMDCSLPGSSVHGIPWPRIVEWVASSFSNYGIKSGFPALQADSLPFESLGKPILACRFYFQFSQLLSLDLEKRADD